MENQEDAKRKGIILIILSVMIGFLGVAGFIASLFFGLKDLNKQLLRFRIPGSAELTLNEPGTYTIFHEYKSDFEGKIYNTDSNISGLTIKVVEKDNGKEIPLSGPSSSTTYDFSNHSGYSIKKFKIEKPGVYVFTGEFEDESPDTILAVGNKVTSTLLKTVLGSLTIMFLTLGVSITLLVIGIIKLTKKNKIESDDIYSVNMEE